MNRRPRILVTRTRQQASELAAQLQQLGTEPILVPMIQIAEPSSLAALDAAIADLRHRDTAFDWLIFTSANAVHGLASRAHAQAARLHPKRVAAIGPATAKAIEQAGLLPHTGAILLPPQYVAESLAQSILQQPGDTPNHCLLVRAEAARDVIPLALESAGHRVSIAAAYRNITPPGTKEALLSLLGEQSEWPDAITFTSSSTAKNLVELLGSIGHTIPPEIALASIGPITSATLRELGHEPTFEAAEPTVEALVHAITKHLQLG